MKLNIIHLALAAVAVVAGLVGAGVVQPDFGLGGSLLVTAMAVQSSYSARIPAAVAGMVADMQNYKIDTRICETAAGIGFGLAVGRGSADNGAILGGAAAADFLGISVRDVTLMNNDGDEYARYSNMAVLTEGTIWVTVGGDVTDGADVTFNGTTGVLSSTAAGDGQFAITGARWMDTVSSGGLARLRLSGHLPSA